MKKLLSMKRVLLMMAATVIVVPLLVIAIQLISEPDNEQPGQSVLHTPENIRRGEYLASAGNCIACHTTRGSEPFAGGRAIVTPFGSIYASNITPDLETGIGRWTADDFWRALHHGKSRDGHFLYPAFPYPSYTKVSRDDADAMFAFLRTVSAVRRANREHELRFPYNQRLLLAFWRALYFSPGTFVANDGKSAEWNRGAYLVQGLGHCAACHTARNTLGATVANADLAGGLIPMLNWHASSLTSDADTGLGTWSARDLADLLKTGVSPRGNVFGPMAEVVGSSLQHLTPQDIDAMTVYLKSVPTGASKAPSLPQNTSAEAKAVLKQGAKIYENHCAECHQADGRGKPPAYPPLAANVSVANAPALNTIRIILHGGYPPSTAGNPRPYGMPPYGWALSDEEVAAVASFIRSQWGNQGAMVSPNEVGKFRSAPIE